MINRILLTTLLAILLCLSALAQKGENRLSLLEEQLNAYAVENPKIEKQIDISMTGNITQFVMAFSKETKINLTLAPGLDQQVVANFSDTKPKDILLHFCRFYDLDLKFSGSIISLVPFDKPREEAKEKLLDITYNGYNNNLSLNLKRDTLDKVLKVISSLSKKNVISTKAASDIVVSGYIGLTDFDDALEQLATRNELSIEHDEKGYYVLDVKKDEKDGKRKATSNRNTRTSAKRTQTNKDIVVRSRRDSTQRVLINVVADNAPMSDVIKAVSDESNDNFFIYSPLEGTISLKLEDVDFERFLEHILKGSKHGFQLDNDIYLIGDKTLEGLRASRVLQLEHRSVEQITELIPAELLTSVEVKEFMQMNSLILSGSASAIAELTDFVYEIDRPVPVVTIELLIVDVTNTRNTSAGIEAGIGQNPSVAGGQIASGFDFSFSPKAINSLLDVLAGNGVVNLGRVNPNFYFNLQAVEDDGYVNVRSKPQLSTLNGVEATFNIGETRYFLQERTTLTGAQNPVTTQDRQYQAVNADFAITVLPVISGDENVTLNIQVSQSDFLGQSAPNAPPPSVNRNFNSNIRVQDGEMIVLGGLQSKGIEESGSGIPLLARIPVVKWLFSKRQRTKRASKLLIFVKPTITY